jgi:hypothetical protein
MLFAIILAGGLANTAAPPPAQAPTPPTYYQPPGPAPESPQTYIHQGPNGHHTRCDRIFDTLSCYSN